MIIFSAALSELHENLWRFMNEKNTSSQPQKKTWVLGLVAYYIFCAWKSSHGRENIDTSNISPGANHIIMTFWLTFSKRRGAWGVPMFLLFSLEFQQVKWRFKLAQTYRINNGVQQLVSRERGKRMDSSGRIRIWPGSGKELQSARRQGICARCSWEEAFFGPKSQNFIR